jgi:formiminoglutamase
MGLRWHQVVSPWNDSTTKGICFIGFCSEEGVKRNQGRPGASEGPAALRSMMSNLPHQHGESLFDAGDIQVNGNDLETSQETFATTVAAVIRHGQLVVGLGGGHEIAWASWQGLVSSGVVRQGDRVGVLNLDAHFDLRSYPVPTSGTSFSLILDDAENRNISVEYRAWGVSEASNTAALFDRANHTANVSYELDTDLRMDRLKELEEDISAWLSQLDHVYLTTCLDVLPASVAPGVSAPAALGVSVDVVEALIRFVGESGKLRIADFAELCPRLDIDNRTARTAARLIWRLVRSYSKR